MQSPRPIHLLHPVTNRLLDAAPNNYAELLQATKDLYELLVNVSALDTEATAHRVNNHLQTGKAIGTTWAAMCIQDLLRTKKFMDGVYHAVQRLYQQQPGRTIHILYAGTGPFATLLLPLTARFASDALQFTLLEVNATSYDCLRRTMTAFQLQGYVREMHCTDATTFRMQDDMPVDILLSETMQHALIKEPQVAIVMNLLPQMREECLLIPEKITLHAELVNESKVTRQKLGESLSVDEVRYKLGNVFELSRQTIMSLPAHHDIPGYRFPLTTIYIPSAAINNFPKLVVQTTIQVFDNDVLLPDQCALTLPLPLANLSGDPQTDHVQFTYVTGINPGLQVFPAPAVVGD